MLIEHIIGQLGFFLDREGQLFTVDITDREFLLRKIGVEFHKPLPCIRKRIEYCEGEGFFLIDLLSDHAHMKLKEIVPEIPRLLVPEEDILIGCITVATTNAVMGGIFEHELPDLRYSLMRIVVPEGMADCENRLEGVRNEVLDLVVQLLQVRPRREDGLMDPAVLPFCQFSFQYRQ